MDNDFEIVSDDKTTNSFQVDNISSMLDCIRPECKTTRIIERVKNLLKVDPSSACQRIFNASIHDLRKKILHAGMDIAKDTAKRFNLPAVDNIETLENQYSVSNVIELSYRMGILSRPEWRRLKRSYDIRKDLEHEDDEYEATPEDCFYIFKTSIEVILSKDPVCLLKTGDVTTLISAPQQIIISGELLNDYGHSPNPRQKEIIKMLIGVARDSKKTDIMRQNAMELLRNFNERTNPSVKVEIAEEEQQNPKREKLSLPEAKIMYAAGIFPYLKQQRIFEFFDEMYKNFERVGYSWKSCSEHLELLENFEDIGGLKYCPDSLREKFIEWLVRCYIGEPGGYGMGINRHVFYSNIAAPKVPEILGKDKEKNIPILMRIMVSKEIKNLSTNKYLSQRIDRLKSFLI